MLTSRSESLKMKSKEVNAMLEITATEFKVNFGHYLDLVPTEDIWITRNGKFVARLVNPNVSAVDSISGILKGKAPDDIDRHSLRDERMERHAVND